MDLDIFSEPSPIEEGIAPLVAKLRTLGCHVLASCEGHSVHEKGVLYTSAPFVMFVPEQTSAPLICSIDTQKTWGNLEFTWAISSYPHDEFNIAYRISPIKFEASVTAKQRRSIYEKFIGVFSYRYVAKRHWPKIRESITKDINRICRMLPAERPDKHE